MSVVGRIKTIGALGLLTAALPANVAVTGAALARRALVSAPAPLVLPAQRPLTVLVSGGKMTKALTLCRAFHAAGHRVVLADSAAYRGTGHRNSRAVDRFRIVPEASDDTADEYAEALAGIVLDERVDVYVPVCSPASSVPDARAKKLLSQHCEVLHPDLDQVQRLDDKFAFARSAQAVGLPVPETHLITDPDQVRHFDFDADGGPRHYVLKSIAYDPVHRLDLTRLPFPDAERDPSHFDRWLATKPISEENPWIMQEFVEGQEFCTHGTARDGRLSVYLCCASSAFCVNYAMADVPAIHDWVQRYVAAYDLTGQVSFDFVVSADGSVRAIECNPRTHSAITLLHDHPALGQACLGEATIDRPTPSSRPTYWLYHELWRALAHPFQLADVVRTLVTGTDAIFDRADPWPFLLVHHRQIPGLLLDSLRHDRDWLRIDFNIGKLVTVGGD